jgi:hypothetical protein
MLSLPRLCLSGRWTLLWLLGGLLISSTDVRAEAPAIPDFTAGDAIPKDARHDWNLGATGARGWIYCDRLVTSDARQIAITQVASGSPADGILASGDVLLGVGGRPFAADPRTEFGQALTATAPPLLTTAPNPHGFWSKAVALSQLGWRTRTTPIRTRSLAR